MRSSTQELWPTVLLLFLALATVPASAFYNPNTGRWLNRDPQEEAGGPSLNGFAANDGANQIDPLGLIYLSVYQTHQISPGEKVKGWTIGGLRSWGKTLMNLRYANVVTRVPEKCTCCLHSFDVILEVDSLYPVVNSRWFRDLGGEFAADAAFANEVSAHEAVHAAAGLYMGAALGGKFLSDCEGHCWKSWACNTPGGTWTEESCRQHAESELRRAGTWISREINRVAIREWDTRVHAYGTVTRNSRFTSVLEPAFRDYYQAETTRLRAHRFCPDDVCLPPDFPGFAGDL